MLTIQVSKLLSVIKTMVEENCEDVSVEGEVSNFTSSPSGHYYFSLSDSQALLSCCLFRMDALRNPHLKDIKNGDKVICKGSVSVYLKRGHFQLITQWIVPAGAGALKAQFELLKQKLGSEGLFNSDRKKPIPPFPKRVAVITSPQGAAIQDFLKVYGRRVRSMDILIVPSLVQGEKAPENLRNALKRILDVPSIELVVLTRGGGSLEDLWAFNDEQLIRLLSTYPLPTISAIGHEVDVTLCDLVCDVRAETPTAAAELISAPQQRYIQNLSQIQRRLFSQGENMRQKIELRMERVNLRRVLERFRVRVHEYQRRLEVLNPSRQLHQLFPIQQQQLHCDQLWARMTVAMEKTLVHYDRKIQKWEVILQALNPKKVLQRGYTFVQTKDGSVISSCDDFHQLKEQSPLILHFHDGVGDVLKV